MLHFFLIWFSDFILTFPKRVLPAVAGRFPNRPGGHGFPCGGRLLPRPLAADPQNALFLEWEAVSPRRSFCFGSTSAATLGGHGVQRDGRGVRFRVLPAARGVLGVGPFWGSQNIEPPPGVGISRPAAGLTSEISQNSILSTKIFEK